jgi:hypothetical protein
VTYALLQKDLSIPNIEKLARALRHVKGFVSLDAHTFARDAFGILVRQLEENVAADLQAALRSEGIDTDVVPESELPVLPQTKFSSRVDPSEAGLVIYDPLGRTFLLPWQHVYIIAAGSVELTEFTTERTVRRMEQVDRSGEHLVEYDTRTKEARNNRYLLEIIVSRAVLRYSVKADVALFRSLGDRATRDFYQNFRMVLEDIFKFIPDVPINRGALHLRNGQDFFYPSKNAFYEEITWFLWRLKTAGAT